MFFRVWKEFGWRGFKIKIGDDERIFNDFFIGLLGVSLASKLGQIGFNDILSFLKLNSFFLNVIWTGDFFGSFRLHSYLNILYF